MRLTGHIACDAASNSEIVLPLVVKNQIIGVLDIDSTVFSRFETEDEAGLGAWWRAGFVRNVLANRRRPI